MPIPRSIFQELKQLIPPLDGTLHKGQSGRVGVLGGALDYTGAPYFAAISALRLVSDFETVIQIGKPRHGAFLKGADLSHVICSPTAAGAIKSYSPDLIVHPILREDAPMEKVHPELESLLSRLHVLIIGPGLGREPYMQNFAKIALCIARSKGMFVVLDADSLLLVGQDPYIIRGYRRAVVTPNMVEFKRLSDMVGIDPSTPPGSRASLLSRHLGGVTVLQKGAKDIISVDTTGATSAEDLDASQLHGADVNKENTKGQMEVDVEGGLKRSGGQGDVLSGLVGTFLAWGKNYEGGVFGDGSIPTSRMPFLAAIGGSMVTRTASRRAFHKEGRSVVTEDMLSEIGKSFAEVFGKEAQIGEDKDKGRL